MSNYEYEGCYQYEMRAWDKEEKQMVRVFEVNLMNGRMLGIYANQMILPIESGNFELLLFSPFADKNGRQICQSDLVRATWKHDREIDGHRVIEVDEKDGTVVFTRGCFSVDTDDQAYLLCDLIEDESCEVEVIGNTYEGAK